VAGIPKALFSNCKGMILISVVEVGFIFSGNVGTGIILAKNKDGTWSKPAACGLTGIGWGLLVGGSVKDIIVFIMDDQTLEGVSGDSGLKMGGQLELTIGPWGRTAKVDIGVSNRGLSGTFSIAYSKGAFFGMNIEGAVVGTRNAVNSYFYEKDVTARQILFSDEVEIQFPTNKVTLMDEVYAKLDKLSAGVAEETSAEEEAKKAAAKEQADKAAESANKMEGVLKVDAATEAAKEAK